MNIAIILAGGSGTRLGANKPKQFVEILNRPILAYTTEIYQKHPDIDAIEIVCHHDWIDYCKEMIIKYSLDKVNWIVPGGESFQKSVINGLQNLQAHMNANEISKNDYVFIHYGAAPFTDEKIITDVIRTSKIRGAAVSATPCYQLMASNDEEKTSKTWVDRDKYIQIACPYGFKLSYLIDVYRRAEEQKLLDRIEPHTTSLIFALGDTLYQAYGNQANIKITTKDDLDLFEGYILMKQKQAAKSNK